VEFVLYHEWKKTIHMFENRVLRKTVGLKGSEIGGERLENLYG
jgi:hypothetical protein